MILNFHFFKGKTSALFVLTTQRRGVSVRILAHGASELEPVFVREFVKILQRPIDLLFAHNLQIIGVST